jgi:hypothetical protein
MMVIAGILLRVVGIFVGGRLVTAADAGFGVSLLGAALSLGMLLWAECSAALPDRWKYR